MATFLDICKNVRAQAAISGDGPINVTGQTGIYQDVVRWVAESYNEIQTLHPNWNFLYREVMITLQASFSSYPALVSEGIREIAKDSFLIQFQLGDKERLPYVPWHSYKNDNRYLVTKIGKPEVVTQDPSGNLLFWPTADEDYEIYFDGYAIPDVMVNSSDVPIFSTQYHDLIKLKSLMKYSEYFNSPEVYKSADINFRILLSKMQFSELPRRNIALARLVRFA